MRILIKKNKVYVQNEWDAATFFYEPNSSGLLLVSERANQKYMLKFSRWDRWNVLACCMNNHVSEAPRPWAIQEWNRKPTYSSHPPVGTFLFGVADARGTSKAVLPHWLMGARRKTEIRHVRNSMLTFPQEYLLQDITENDIWNATVCLQKREMKS